MWIKGFFLCMKLFVKKQFNFFFVNNIELDTEKNAEPNNEVVSFFQFFSW